MKMCNLVPPNHEKLVSKPCVRSEQENFGQNLPLIWLKTAILMAKKGKRHQNWDTNFKFLEITF